MARRKSGVPCFACLVLSCLHRRRLLLHYWKVYSTRLTFELLVFNAKVLWAQTTQYLSAHDGCLQKEQKVRARSTPLLLPGSVIPTFFIQ